MFGKLMHLGFDALLISAFLAGVKRTTGLTCVCLPPSLAPEQREMAIPLLTRSLLLVLVWISYRPALSQVPNKDVRQLLRSYLEVGEYVFDFAVVVFGRSSSFERRR
ncbi:DUF1748-domain-containing protein [Lactarius psammicola]|nr:DUF1748-domain-containing protein [Lactarius psammicola]